MTWHIFLCQKRISSPIVHITKMNYHNKKVVRDMVQLLMFFIFDQVTSDLYTTSLGYCNCHWARVYQNGMRYGASQCGAKSNVFNPSLGLKNSRFALIFRYIPYIPLARTKREPKRSACCFTTYVGIVCDPSIEFIINRPRRNKTTMAKTASAIDVPLVQRLSYDTGTSLTP